MAKFIDLFAGIGGLRLGFEAAGGECVFSSEIDRHAAEMYEANFGDAPHGDIRTVDADTLPDHDILIAGFPCQPFSSAGERQGFKDPRGTLFFEIVRLLEAKLPTVVVLENVAGFFSHDKGETFKTVKASLEGLGYTVSAQWVNANRCGIPQNRKRVIIVGHRGGREFDFTNVGTRPFVSLTTVLNPSGKAADPASYTLLPSPVTQKSGLRFAGYLNKPIRKKGTRPNTLHLSRVHRQPNRIYCATGTHPTISASETGGRYYILHNGRVRKLAVDEVYAVMGFPDSFKRVGTKAQQLKVAGNAVAPPMSEAVATEVMNQFFKEKTV